MNFTSYIARQKTIVLSRHVGEEVLITTRSSSVQQIKLRSSDEIMSSIRSNKGLNTTERMANCRATTKVYDIA